jgi:hypothetical protein
LEVGLHRVKVSFIAATLMFVFTSHAPAVSQSKLTATTTIVVTDVQGAVVPHAHVRIVPFPRSPRLEADERGTVSVELSPGKYAIFVTAPSFVVKSETVEISGTTDQHVTISLRVAGGSTIEVQQPQSSPRFEQIWRLETRYWSFAKSSDLNAYAGLWHTDAVAWRTDGYVLGKDGAIAWLKQNLDQGLYLEELEINPEGVRITGDVAVTFYHVRSLWIDELGRGEPRHYRINHTWIRSGATWQIISETSMLTR